MSAKCHKRTLFAPGRLQLPSDAVRGRFVADLQLLGSFEAHCSSIIEGEHNRDFSE